MEDDCREFHNRPKITVEPNSPDDPREVWRVLTSSQRLSKVTPVFRCWLQRDVFVHLSTNAGFLGNPLPEWDSQLFVRSLPIPDEGPYLETLQGSDQIRTSSLQKLANRSLVKHC